MPLCYGIFHGGGAEQWLEERFQRTFTDVDNFLSGVVRQLVSAGVRQSGESV